MTLWHMMTERYGEMREPYTAAVTLVEVVLYAGLAGAVGRARGKYKVDAPSTDGPQAFRRFYRVHMNTLEQLALQLPLLWLAALSVGDMFAAAFGALWIIGRAVYVRDYHRNPAGRHPGFLISFVANIILLVGAVMGVIKSF